MNKSKFALAAALIFVTALVIADSLGEYECNTCNPSDPMDVETQAFIANTVNSDLEEWMAGEHVLITNPDTGESGVWGRASAVGPRQYLGPPAAFGYSLPPSGGTGSGGGGAPGGSVGGGPGGGEPPRPDDWFDDNNCITPWSLHCP